MKLPDISVVLPVYNGEKYIHQAIDSVLTQTLDNFELIIINDGSTDNTINVVESYKDNRIKIINNKHDFINSLNIGISVAAGKYIARMDADDLMTLTRLETQFAYMESNQEVDVCGGWIELFGDDEDVVKKEESYEKIILKALFENPMAHPTVMFKTDLRKLFPYGEGIYNMYQEGYQHAEDYKLWTDLITKGCKIVNLPMVVLKYRCSESQVTYIYKKDMAISTIKVQAEYINVVMDMIVKSEDSFFDAINEALKLYSKKKVTFKSFRNIIYNLGDSLGENLVSYNL